MITDNLKSIVQMGKALWADSDQRDSIIVDTFSSVSLLELSEDESVEQTARCLLENARRTTAAVNRLREMQQVEPLFRAFYSLHPDERFLLVLLHLEHWSYARIARFFGMTIEGLEIMAWRIRIQVSSKYPLASPMDTPNCPEFDVHRPWTQRFLDEEHSNGSEKVFLQNHLMICTGCRRALQSCRELYYAVDAAIPRSLEKDESTQKLLSNLQRANVESRLLVKKSKVRLIGSRKSLLSFLMRPDILVVTLGVVYFIRLMFSSKH